MKTKISFSVILFVGLVLFALDWAALHDIIKSNESSYTIEYSMLVLSLPVFVFLVWKLFGLKRKSVQNL